MSPIQVRLLTEIRVIVILTSSGIQCPCRSTKLAQPVVRRTAVRPGVAPDVPVPLRTAPRRSAVDKPWMLVRRVVRNKIKNHSQPDAVRRREQPVEVVQRPE